MRLLCHNPFVVSLVVNFVEKEEVYDKAHDKELVENVVSDKPDSCASHRAAVFDEYHLFAQGVNLARVVGDV